MGLIRNGARTFLDIMVKSCKLSHNKGFQFGLIAILGPERGSEVFLAWKPLCELIEGLVGIDNYFNRVDVVEELDDSEDQELL